MIVNNKPIHLTADHLTSSVPDDVGKRMQAGYVRQKPPSNENGAGALVALARNTIQSGKPFPRTLEQIAKTLVHDPKVRPRPGG